MAMAEDEARYQPVIDWAFAKIKEDVEESNIACKWENVRTENGVVLKKCYKPSSVLAPAPPGAAPIPDSLPACFKAVGEVALPAKQLFENGILDNSEKRLIWNPNYMGTDLISSSGTFKVYIEKQAGALGGWISARLIGIA